MTRLDELVGREQELALINRVLDQPDARSFTIEISGEPGIGKTHLAMEVLARAAERGHRTLVGRASEFEESLPFGLFADALDDYVLSNLAGITEALPSETVHALAGVLPSLALWPGLSLAGSRTERRLSHQAVRQLLEHVASKQPLTLALDDCHWADPASVELLQHLLRHPPRAAITLLLSSRPNQLSAAIASELQRLERSGDATRLILLPLGLSEAVRLLPADLDQDAIHSLCTQSGGNPFYLVELARAVKHADPGKEVPTSIAEAVQGELEILDKSSRRLIEAASVIGDPFEYSLAAHVTELSLSDDLDELDRLMEKDLVRLSGTPERYRFRHPIVRNAVYYSMGESSRRAIHRRLATILDSRGAPISSQAHHVERCAHVGDDKAITVLTEAGHDASTRAPATAARYFEAALRLLPERDTGSEREMELLTGLAIALGSSGALEQSRATLHRVLDALPPGTSALRVRAIAFVALVEHLLGNHDDAQRLLLFELKTLANQRSPQACEIKAELAYGCFFSANWQEMRRWAEDVLNFDSDDSLLSVMGESLLALAMFGLGSTTSATAHCDSAASKLGDLTDGQLAARLEAPCWLGWAELCLGKNDAAISLMRRTAEIARSTGQEHLIVAMLVVEAMGLLAIGNVREALDTAEAAIDSASLSSNHLFLTWALTIRCMCELAAGTPEKAIEYGRQATEAGIRTRSPWSKVAGCYLAESWLEAGDAQRCKRELLLPGGSLNFPPFPYYEVRCFETLVRAEIHLGRVDEARHWAERAQAVASKSGLDIHAVESLRAMGLASLASGSPRDALDHFQQASGIAANAGLRVEAARTRILVADALHLSGEDDHAQIELESAIEEFRPCGAKRYRQQAESIGENLKAGATSARHSPTERLGWPKALSSLTERERDVAQLINRGNTNKEIAGSLSLSEKTVETYVSRIFSKLDVTSRSEIAVLVERARSTVA